MVAQTREQPKQGSQQDPCAAVEYSTLEASSTTAGEIEDVPRCIYERVAEKTLNSLEMREI